MNQDLPGMLAVAEGVAKQEWPHTMDAQVWAREFAKMYPMIWREGGAISDVESVMLGWFANAIMAGYDTANARRAEERRSGWIPVSERLPEPEIDVLVRGTNGFISIDSVESFEGFDVAVTHWMPLPDGPHGE